MKDPKKFSVLYCPCCGHRHSPQKFATTLEPIQFPFGFAVSLGRARGFATVERFPWSALPSLQNTPAWKSILNLYARLAAAYDLFYETLGFMSPKMRTLLQSSYSVAYLPNPLENYATAYGADNASEDIVEEYGKDDFLDAYSSNPSFVVSWR